MRPTARAETEGAPHRRFDTDEADLRRYLEEILDLDGDRSIGASDEA